MLFRKTTLTNCGARTSVLENHLPEVGSIRDRPQEGLESPAANHCLGAVSAALGVCFKRGSNGIPRHNALEQVEENSMSMPARREKS